MQQGPTHQELALLIRKFLEAEPEWLNHDVRYFRMGGSDDPQPYLSAQATKAFAHWLAAQKLVRCPERVDRFCDWLDQR